jgi:HAD superfamily hydrolase (TIGR01549 family)
MLDGGIRGRRYRSPRLDPPPAMSSFQPAVTFDLWHTLLYLEPEAEETYMRRQVESGANVLDGSDASPGAPRIGHEQLQAEFEREYARAVAEAAQGRTVTPSEQMIRAARASGRIPRPEAYEAELEKLLSQTPFRVGEESADVLRELGERGYAVGVISNTVGEPGRLLRPLLRTFDFNAYVRAYTFSDEHPWTKPSPEIFRTALRALGSDPSVAVHVGDGWSDIEGGRRAGLRSAVLFTGLQGYGEQYRRLFVPPTDDATRTGPQVKRLSEVVPLVRRLLPAAIS